MDRLVMIEALKLSEDKIRAVRQQLEAIERKEIQVKTLKGLKRIA